MSSVRSSDDDSDLGTRSDCPTSGKERTAVAPDSPNRLSTKPSSPTASASTSCVPRPGIQVLSTAPSLLTLQRTPPPGSAMPTDIRPDLDPRAGRQALLISSATIKLACQQRQASSSIGSS